MPKKSAVPTPSPAAQLDAFIDRFDPGHGRLFRSVRTAVRKRLPTVTEMAYDYGHSVVIAFTPTSHGKDGIVSIALREEGVRLYFSQWARLPDPAKLLQGSAKQVRYVAVESARQLTSPEVTAMFDAAIAQSPVPMRSAGNGGLVIRPTAAAKRARTKENDKPR